MINRRYPNESSGDRLVRHQPMCLSEGKSIWECNGDLSVINVRRCREAAVHLMLADLPCQAVSELCDFEGLCARLRCGDGYNVIAQLGTLLATLKTLDSSLDYGQVSAAIAKADHFRRWLKRDMAVINDAPERELFASCSEQPFSSVVRQSVVPAMLSGGDVATAIDESALMLSVVIGRSLPDFDDCEAVLRGHTACVRCVAWGLSSTKCVSGSDDGTIRVWIADTGAVEVVLTGHTGSVRCVALSSKGVLASGGKDKTVRIWDAVLAKLKDTLEGHLAEVNALAWGKSTETIGAYLASGSSDKTIRLWDANNHPCTCVRVLHLGSEVLTVAYAPDGLHIAAGTDEEMRVHIFNVHSWKCTLKIQEVDGVNSIAYSPSGDAIASCTGNFSVWGTVNIWSARSGRKLRALKGNAHSINSISWSHDGSVIATASYDKKVRVWDAKTCEQLKQFTGHSDCISSVQFSLDGSRLASASHDRTIRIYDVLSLTQPLGVQSRGDTKGNDAVIFGYSEDAVTDLCWSPDGEFIASSSQDASVRVWASRTGRQTVCVTGGTDYTSKNTDEVLGVSFSADGSFVATAGADGSARFFDARSGSQLYLFSAHSDRVTSVRISPDGFVLASSSKDKTVKLWGITSRLQLHVLQGHTEEVRCVVWSPDSQMLASGADDQFVIIWNAHGGESVQVLKGHSGGVYALDWSHNGDLLASRWGTCCCFLCVALSWCVHRLFLNSFCSSSDKSVCIWSRSGGNFAFQKQLQGHEGCVSALSWTKDSDVLASGSADLSVRLWSAGSWECIRTLKGHMDAVTSVAWAPNLMLLASGSRDRSIRIHNTSSSQQLQLIKMSPDH